MAASAVHFEEFQVGDRYRTLGRTVSDFEILQFVTLTGFTEPLFMDMEYIRRESVFKTRVAPGVLTFALAEGLTLQTGILHGTGLALLSYDVRILAPSWRATRSRWRSRCSTGARRRSLTGVSSPFGTVSPTSAGNRSWRRRSPA